MSKELKQVRIDKEYYVLEEDGSIFKANGYKTDNKDLRALIDKEALGKMGAAISETPEYIKHYKKFGMEWEPMSDSGHMRYGPEGAFILGLACDYANQVISKTCTELGVSLFSVVGTNMFNLEEKPVREHAELFGDRLYQLEIDNKKFVLRYAACHQQFAMIKDWTISYKNLPFAAYEIADSYRLEQTGELFLGFRLRRFLMPDTHIFCKDIDDAKKLLSQILQKMYELMRSFGREYVSLYNITSKDLLDDEKEFLKGLLKIEGKPVLVAVYPPGKNYYWTLNIESHITDQLGRPREIATVQIDIGNAERFGIKFKDSDGKEKYPIILHTALIGGIERFIYAIFDTALSKGNKAILPLWLSPTQVRLCPITDRNIKRANEIADVLEANGIRVDIDDRGQSLQHKVLDSEKHWIPYIVAIGDQEESSDKLTVRRRNAQLKKYKILELVSEIKKETKDKPFRRLPYPRDVAVRPIF